MLERKNNNNNLLIKGLLITILCMVVGYATLSSTLSINGTSTITSTTAFDVKFTGVTTTPTGRATSTHTSFENNTTSNTFSFGVTLNQPGDKMIYNVTIKNLGTIDAEVGSFTNPTVWGASDILTYSVTGISVGDEILVSDADGVTFTITVEWPVGTNIPVNKTQDLEFEMHFIQKGTNNGEVGVITPIISSTYIHIDTNNNEIVDQGDQILFGTYPQTKVTNETLINTLNTRAGTLPVNGANETWTSYKYYKGTGTAGWESNKTDYMWYQDIEEGGEKYRGVYFTSYRPYITYYVSNTSKSYQDDNGYTTGTIYWFKYEDIVWDVGKNENNEVTLISHTLLDARDFYHAEKAVRYNSTGPEVYANNYEYSDIRTWLNETFYNTSFTVNEQNIILSREIDNSASTTNDTSNEYISNNTIDKIFLLSYNDIVGNTTTYNIILTKSGSDYAKAQGIEYSSTGNSWYLLRSPDAMSKISATYVGVYANIFTAVTDYTMGGIAAVLKISL